MMIISINKRTFNTILWKYWTNHFFSISVNMLNKFYSYFNTSSQFFKILTVFYYIDIVLIIISTKRTFLHFESSLNFEVVCSKSIPYVNQFTGYKIEFLLFIHVISYTICDMYNSFNSNECFFESKFHMVPHFFFQ